MEHKCPYKKKDGTPCDKEYDTKQQLDDHISSNHFKLRAQGI